MSLAQVYVAQNPVEAQLVADRLEAGGVHAIVKVDTFAAPSIPFPSVWVARRDLQRARGLLAHPADGHAASSPD